LRDILYTISRWVLFIAIVFFAVYLFYSQVYLVYGPKVADVDSRLPTPFRSSTTIFWSWFLGSASLGGGLGYWTFRVLRNLRSRPTSEIDEPDQDDPELAAACEAITILRRGQEREPAYLIIAEGDAPLALMAAAGLGPDAVAPELPAPIRGLRTAVGLFIQCGGPDTLAGQSACQVLATMAGSPPLRGIIVQIPVAMLFGPQSQGFARSSRAVLRDVAESIATRCPVYVVISGMEDVPGFLEFALRSPAEYRTSARFGFSLPGGADPAREAVAREYDRLIAWYTLSILDLMEAGPLLQEGNEALFSLSRWFLQAREPILQFLDAAKPGGDDPLEMLNCYLAATGDAPDRSAFVESLMQVKVAGDSRSARWSLRAVQADRTLRRVGFGLGAAGGTMALLAWTLIFVNLKPTGWLVVLIALLITVGWGATWYELLRGFRRARNRTA